MSHMLLGHLGCLGVNDWFGLCLPGSRPGSGQAVHMQDIEMNQKCFPLQGTVACGGRTGRDQCQLQGSGCGKRVVSPGSACLKAAWKELCCQSVCRHPAGSSLSTQQRGVEKLESDYVPFPSSVQPGQVPSTSLSLPSFSAAVLTSVGNGEG